MTAISADSLDDGEKDPGGDECRVLVLDLVGIPLIVEDVDEQGRNCQEQCCRGQERQTSDRPQELNVIVQTVVLKGEAPHPRRMAKHVPDDVAH